MSYESVMRLQWELLNARDPLPLLDSAPEGDRSVLSAGMTYGWWLDRLRRDARILGVLRDVLPASSVLFAGSSREAVRGFIGSAQFAGRGREVGSTYPPSHATIKAFVEYVRAGGWRPTGFFKECFDYEAGMAVPSEATYSSGTPLGGSFVVAPGAWLVCSRYDFEMYARRLHRALSEKPWHLAIRVHFPKEIATIVVSLAKDDSVRRVRLKGETASVVVQALGQGSGEPDTVATDLADRALNRLVDEGFLGVATS